MNRLDKAIRNNLISQAPKMSEKTSKHFYDTLSDLTSPSSEKKSGIPILLKIFTGFGCTFTAAAAAILLLVNLNQNIAYAMQDIPFIGNLVRVVTIYKKDIRDDYHYEDINVPQVESQTGLEESIDYINADIKQLTDVVIEQFEKDAAKLPDSHFGLTIDYETITNNDDWFTLRLMLHYAAGSTSTEYRFYHIDKKAGKIVTLSDIFVDNYDYVTAISDDIIRQMNEQMDADESIYYWIKRDGAKNFYEFEKIDPEQNFYFAEDGNLVIVFQKYEVAPGYMGNCEFEISKTIYEKYLR